ncbi:MAG TPA: hypothetical protein VN033_10895 [Vulgatibacter sp.]|nr:hypothetical protein [Vulgatibacter sp.]
MSESRFERGLRAVAWAALALTVATLLTIGALTRPPVAEEAEDGLQTISTARVEGTTEEER